MGSLSQQALVKHLVSSAFVRTWKNKACGCHPHAGDVPAPGMCLTRPGRRKRRRRRAVPSCVGTHHNQCSWQQRSCGRWRCSSTLSCCGVPWEQPRHLGIYHLGRHCVSCPLGRPGFARDKAWDKGRSTSPFPNVSHHIGSPELSTAAPVLLVGPAGARRDGWSKIPPKNPNPFYLTSRSLSAGSRAC